MSDDDPVVQFLRERGCSDEVVEGGLDGLIADWERTTTEVERGYTLGLDDYLNDLDGRQILEDAIELLPEADAESVLQRIESPDQRLKRATTPVAVSLWGQSVAESEGWDPENNWWYFRVPRAPGPLLREDLESR